MLDRIGIFWGRPGGVLSTAEGPRPFQPWDPRTLQHRPPARQPPPAHTAPRPGTPVPPHALPARSPALPRQFRRTPSSRAPQRCCTRIRRMPSPRAHAPRSADVATTATPLLPQDPRWPESVPGRVSQPYSPGSPFIGPFHSNHLACPCKPRLLVQRRAYWGMPQRGKA